MAKVAFLILAHDHPGHLGRLVRALRHPDFSFFIFVDAKTAIEPFVAAVAGVERCYFVAERHKVYWMGFSVIRACIALMKAAMRGAVPFKYLVHLSGSDYPIRRVDEIHDFYARHACEFLSYFKLSDNLDWSHKTRYRYYLDVPALNRREVFKSTRNMVLFLPAIAAYRLLFKLAPKRPDLEGVELYGGSAHWTLTHDCARHVIDITDRTPRLTKFFQRSHCPDELYFQTVVLNSPFAGNVVPGARLRRWQHNTRSPYVLECGDDLKYVDWDGRREGPAILDERDFAALRQSGKLFARKMHPIVSRSLLDRLDEAVQSGSGSTSVPAPEPVPAIAGRADAGR